MKGRYATRITLTTLCAVVLVLGVGAGSATSATPDTCTAQPGKITRSSVGIRAGATPIVCSGSWSAHQAVMWSGTTGQWTSGKWSYGGSRDVKGTGSMTLGAFNRAYHHCAHWRLEVTLRGVVFRGPITTFCS